MCDNSVFIMAEEVAVRKKRMGMGAAKVRLAERLGVRGDSNIESLKQYITEKQIKEAIDKSHATSRVEDKSTPYLVPGIPVESRDFNLDFSDDFAF